MPSDPSARQQSHCAETLLHGLCERAARAGESEDTLDLTPPDAVLKALLHGRAPHNENVWVEHYACRGHGQSFGGRGGRTAGGGRRLADASRVAPWAPRPPPWLLQALSKSCACITRFETPRPRECLPSADGASLGVDEGIRPAPFPQGQPFPIAEFEAMPLVYLERSFRKAWSALCFVLGSILCFCTYMLRPLS